ncbi:WD repeat domain phosphoinositide-interacting protein 3-like [Symsagittifera roscoffensis]|uniref:WD repeat domain phosphoinositide-interacting protein 3-like n=1 Tax=Symsagittifera roscoffensis TaxID=84072 RepID=UPI00307B1EC9
MSGDTCSIMSLRFNQDGGCFVCATSNGFLIFNTDPLREKQRIFWKDGGVGCAEMLFRCSHLALVGGGVPARYPVNKVVIWNGATQSELFEMQFESLVKNVRLRKDRIVVVLETLIKVYTFDLNPLEQERFESCLNPHGLCAVCAVEANPIIAYPGPKVGQLAIASLGSGMPAEYICAHESSLCSIALSKKGDLVATASEKGTLIRVFNTHYKAQVEEFRRGTQPALIYSINFNQPGNLVCVSSDRGTLHIFNLKNSTPNNNSGGRYGRSGSISKRLGQAKTSSGKIELKCGGLPVYCEFSTLDDKSIIAISLAGDYNKFIANDTEGSLSWTRDFSENVLSPRDVFTSFPHVPTVG